MIYALTTGAADVLETGGLTSTAGPAWFPTRIELDPAAGRYAAQ